VIYTDDCSPDETGRLVEEYLADNDPDKKVHLIKNTTRRGGLHNLYLMIHGCEDDAIIVTLDGDDWFPDKDVLKRLNAVYSSGEIWMTYGQFEWASGVRGWAAPYSEDVIQNNAFRGVPGIPTHLRTFYAWLFKKIKLNDLLYMGKFYPMAGDVAFMIPIIEMAGERHQFIADIMYVYNEGTTINEHRRSRQLQIHVGQIIIAKERYKRLVEKPAQRDEKNSIKADIIIFSEAPEKLLFLLDSLKTYVDGIDHIFIVYEQKSVQEKNDYSAIRALHPGVRFHLLNKQRSNFTDVLFSIYLKIQNKYVLFVKGDTVFQKSLCLSECINALKDTGAYAFYFKFNAQEGIRSYNIPLLECNHDMYAWNFAVALDQWASANSLDCVLHKTENTFSFVLQNDYNPTPDGIEAAWANEGRLDRLGLCFGESYVAALS
jgi:glycosyltransferase involved in cell wall biosynthesis